MIRPATSADHPAILPIFLELLHTHAVRAPSSFRPDTSPSEVLPWLSGILSDEQARVYVALEDGVVAGYLYAQTIQKVESPIRPQQHFLSLEHVAVVPACRRRGIATALLSTLIAEAKAKNIDRIELDVWSFNEAAQRFFASHGFRCIRQHMTCDVLKE